MIYILNTQEAMPHWYPGLCDELYYGLDEILDRKSVCAGFNSAYTMELNEKDWVLVTSHKELNIAYLKDTKARIAYYHQGSGANPYFEFINRAQEKKDLEVVDLHLFTLPTFEKLTKKYYNLENTKTIGFPLDLSRYEKYKSVPKKKKIVVSGHITPGKQFYLATYLLKDLMPEYEVWFSVIERPDGVSGKWLDFYAIKEFEDMGFKFIVNHESQEKFYEFLSDASHVFTCSLADTISLPIVEGALCGAVPIVPNIQDYWGQYMDYVGWGYYPFSKYDIELLIRNKNYKWQINTEWFDSKLVVKRFLDVLGVDPPEAIAESEGSQKGKL